MSEHNYRVLTPVGWFTCDTQERLEEELKHCTEEPRAEFYQHGIGWVRYTPQPVDYSAIIQRLVAAGDAMESLQISAEEHDWYMVRNSAEVKKALGE